MAFSPLEVVPFHLKNFVRGSSLRHNEPSVHLPSPMRKNKKPFSLTQRDPEHASESKLFAGKKL